MKNPELKFVWPGHDFAPRGINGMVLRHYALMVVLLNLFSAGMLSAHIFKEFHSFGFPERLGANPESLVQASDGLLYGTTGTLQDVPHTIFRVNPANNEKTVLRNSGTRAGSLFGLIEGPGGALYGLVSWDSSSNRYGHVFRMERDGSDFSFIASFTGITDYYPICLTTDGVALYGTTLGTHDKRGSGTVFRLNADGTGYSILHVFPTGLRVPGRLIVGEGNVLFGLTYLGGRNNRGTVYRMNADGSDPKVIHDCDTTTANPNLLTQGPDGRLYGTTHLTGTLFGMNPDGTGVTVLQRLGARVTFCSLLSGANGTLYGATRNSGANNAGQVFAIQPEGTGFTTLYSFPIDGNGSWPTVLIEGADHALYGCTQQGGIDQASGVIFKLDADGTGYRTLHEFQIAGGDGTSPSRIMEGRDGQIYGTTLRGGAHGYGAIFKKSPDGSGYSLIHHFDKENESSHTEIVQGEDGVLYGTTQSDGGTIFKVSTDGSAFAILHRFGVGGDGAAPMGLIVAGGGVLYGITAIGGAHDRGIAFKIKADGSEYTVLHSFPHKLRRLPLLGVDGALYGTMGTGTLSGPQRGWLFRISPDGVYTALATNWNTPSLIKGMDDAFYGNGNFIVSNVFSKVSYYKLDPADGYSQIHWLGNDWGPLVAAEADWISYYNDTIRKLELVQKDPRDSRLTTSYDQLLDLDDVGASNSEIHDLVRGRDGVYYGTASGGELGFGMVFSFELSPRVSLGERRRELNHLAGFARGTAAGERLAHALRSLDAALEPACWADDDHVAGRLGHRVFQNLRDTLRRLEAAAKHDARAVSNDSIMICIERIAKASETLIRLQNP